MTDVGGWLNWDVKGDGNELVDVLPYWIGGNVIGPDDDAAEEEDDNETPRR